MRISSQQINKSLKGGISRSFYQLITDIKSPEDAEIFFTDFLNNNELETFIKRLAVAYWLKKRRSYTNIKDNLKVSSATIASTQRDLTKKGYQYAIKMMEAEEWANKWSQKIKEFVKKE